MTKDLLGKDVILKFHPTLEIENLIAVPMVYRLSINEEVFEENTINPKEVFELRRFSY